MSTKNPFFVSPPEDFQSFGSGKFLVSWAGRSIPISFNGGNYWQHLPDYVNWGLATPKQAVEDTPNDNSKVITVPTGKLWELTSVFMNYIATASVGNRYLRFKITGGQDFWQVDGQTSVTANQNIILQASQNYGILPDEAGAGYFMSIPSGLRLTAGQTFTIGDADNIDSNDDILLRYFYNEYDGLLYKSLTVDATDLQISWSESIIAGSEQSINVLKLD